MRTDYAGHERAYQKRRHNPEYGGWGKRDGFAEDWRISWQPLIQKKTFPKRGKLIELGCGAGNLSIRFAQAGYGVTGVEIAPTAIDWAIENADQANVDIQFIQGDVLALSEVDDASFDIALDGRCFHCIIGKDRALFLQTAHRILKYSGVLVINTMCNEIPVSASWCDSFDPQTRCTIHDGVATRYIGDSNDIIQEVIQAKFRVLSVDVLPPQNDDDLADLQIIAEKR